MLLPLEKKNMFHPSITIKKNLNEPTLLQLTLPETNISPENGRLETIRSFQDGQVSEPNPPIFPPPKKTLGNTKEQCFWKIP